MPQPNINDSALVRMLSTLDRKQLKGFKFYLECPLFNTNKTLEELFLFLEKKALKSSRDMLPESTLLKTMQVSSPQADKLFSKLLHLLNRYIYLERNQEEETSEYPEIFRHWYELGLDQDLLERELKKMHRKMKGPAQSATDLYHRMRLEHHYTAYQAQMPRKTQADNLENLDHLLDQYYWVTKLKHLCASYNAGRIFSKASPRASLDLSPQQQRSLPPLGQAYLHILKLFRSETISIEETQHVFHILETGPKFGEEDSRDLYGYLLNLSIRNIGRELVFENLVLELYDAMLDKNLLTSFGKIPSGHFKNIVSIKSRKGKLEEAERFISEYQSYLTPSDLNPLVPYCQGLILFFRQEYLVAMRHFRSLLTQSGEDMFWALEIRSMLWKSYYEGYQQLSLEEHEEMLKLYHSFRIFVSRNTLLSDYHKSCYQNFIRIFNRLIKVGEQSTWAVSKSDLNSLKERVTSIEELAHKRWIFNAIQRKIDQF